MTTDVNTKVIDLTNQNHQLNPSFTNIYPGVIPNSNIQQTRSPPNFSTRFPSIIQFAKAHNTERYLNDRDHDLITPKRELHSHTSQLRDRAAHSYYASLQNQKKQEITNNIVTNPYDYLLQIYNKLVKI